MNIDIIMSITTGITPIYTALLLMVYPTTLIFIYILSV